MSPERGLLAVFSNLDDLQGALSRLKGEGVSVRTVYSPVPVHGIQEILKTRPSPVRFFTLLGGALGIVSGFSLAAYANLKWSFITGGKPVLAWIPFVVVGFEFTILLGVLFTVVSMLLLARLPRFRIPGHYDPRFSVDRFGVLVDLGEGDAARASRILRNSGAEEVREVS